MSAAAGQDLGPLDGLAGGQPIRCANRRGAEFSTHVVTAREVVGIDTTGAARTVPFSVAKSVAAPTVVLGGLRERTKRVDAEWLFPFTGADLRTARLEGAATLDERGFVLGAPAVMWVHRCVDRS